MPWRFTSDADVYADRAWGLLAADPAAHTVALTVMESARAGRRWSGEPMLFGWYDDGGQVRGAVSMTPPYELLLAAVPHDALPALVAALRAEPGALPGVTGAAATVERFAGAWTAGTGLRAAVALRLRLHRLAALRPPAPPPAGVARPAAEADRATAVRWMAAFEAEAGVRRSDVEATVRDRLGDGRLWLWEDAAGATVSFAARTAPAAGVARIAPVYTPPEHRRRGYGGAVTAACTADALRRGAAHVVLFTDLANPTANALYRRIGFRPIGEYRVTRFAGPA
jgi:predicted GNAT family acetyltransferase